MVNVCFLSGDMSRTGGTERVLSIIANELSKKDDKFNIHILSITNESNSSYFALNKNIKTERILKNKDVNFKKHYFQVVKGIRQYIKKNKIDILIDVEVIASLFSIPATSYLRGPFLNATSLALLKLKSSTLSLLVLISANITPLSFSISS